MSRKDEIGLGSIEMNMLSIFDKVILNSLPLGLVCVFGLPC